MIIIFWYLNDQILYGFVFLFLLKVLRKIYYLIPLGLCMLSKKEYDKIGYLRNSKAMSYPVPEENRRLQLHVKYLHLALSFLYLFSNKHVHTLILYLPHNHHFFIMFHEVQHMELLHPIILYVPMTSIKKGFSS